ncbi:MAG: L-aspartate oxidase [Cyanobacteria bacterium SZAS LIN-2]|nr:L-aspartate oxidase [Cyanobacteria bacterium SZAS LIN-3]MBS1998252.1 L-aspartate oxidase [Cyanobacteria bacterium SZAS LIN-2]
MSASISLFTGDWPSSIEADVLIIGSGLAGLLLALQLASTEVKVVLASKAALGESNSAWAQGGVAAVTGANPFDSPELHLADTIAAGAGLTDVAAATSIVSGGARLIDAFAKLGVPFDKNPAGVFDLALEGGHKQARVLHSKDTTGRSIVEALADRVRAAAVGGRLTILENTCAADLLTLGGVCVGAEFIADDGVQQVRASHTVLATGGLGQVFERTTNPALATGDGVALAYRIGAELADMEFVQFHPTALRLDNAPAFLISEAARGAGATLLDHKGRRFVRRFHQDGELATRDVVSRAIHTVMAEYELKQVFLDLRPIGAEALAERFPNIVKTCAQYGIDVFSEPVPIAPAAHYMMGGIRADVSGRTSVAGLYAIGECSCTGLHGANRLASNSLLEAGVMALNLADLLLSTRDKSVGAVGQSVAGQIVIPSDLQDFRKQMYRHAGLVRSRLGLEGLLRTPAINISASGQLSIEQLSARNIYQVGLLIARAALMRNESRGAHLRDDYRHSDDVNFARHLFLSANAGAAV